jgi:endonuclease YncB( thermonuclease family)
MWCSSPAVERHIADGDTLWLEAETQAEPAVIRIEGIDAPKICQPWGDEAGQAPTELALNRHVLVKVAARDEHRQRVRHAQRLRPHAPTVRQAHVGCRSAVIEGSSKRHAAPQHWRLHQTQE